MSWAANRNATREEDKAYCLLGLFGVNMPMLYGEGGRNAFFRLQEQILMQQEDYSIFTWTMCAVTEPGSSFALLMAESPAMFGNCFSREFMPQHDTDLQTINFDVLENFTYSAIRNIWDKESYLLLLRAEREDPDLHIKMAHIPSQPPQITSRGVRLHLLVMNLRGGEQLAWLYQIDPNGNLVCVIVTPARRPAHIRKYANILITVERCLLKEFEEKELYLRVTPNPRRQLEDNHTCSRITSIRDSIQELKRDHEKAMEHEETYEGIQEHLQDTEEEVQQQNADTEEEAQQHEDVGEEIQKQDLRTSEERKQQYEDRMEPLHQAIEEQIAKTSHLLKQMSIETRRKFAAEIVQLKSIRAAVIDSSATLLDSLWAEAGDHL